MSYTIDGSLWSAFDNLSQRFAGADLQYRRHTNVGPTGWPKPWRARLVVSKNERSEFRVAGFGDTPDEAIQELCWAVARVSKT